MRFFYDAEFLEDGERVWPISIGIVAEDGRTFYRVYADTLCNSEARQKIRDHRFVMSEVVPHLPAMAIQAVLGRDVMPGGAFDTHPLIVPRWRVALELEAFIAAYESNRYKNELWAYYGAYDHLVLSQTFGTMMQLPGCVPMFTHELMQLEEDVNERRAAAGLDPVPRPAQSEEHNALADASWDRAFYQALREGDVTSAPRAWAIDEERDLVTVPSRVFVAGYERLESVGPNEGLDQEDKEPARRLWDALL